MAVKLQDIYVYAHWMGMETPLLVGKLIAEQVKSRKAFSFEYDEEWVQSKTQFNLDPDLFWYSGVQHPVAGKSNFGFILDSMPDTWGRTLMKRRSLLKAREDRTPVANLSDIDFLLGVHDFCRMGALRFKTDPNGPFLDNSKETPAPPWINIRDLQYSAEQIELYPDSREMNQWLAQLLIPGSSLGGARPKANVLDSKNNLWIAKFPSQNDQNDKALWEMLAFRLAINAGIIMADCKVKKVLGKHHTFLTKRFDRIGLERIHFASAMCLIGKNEDLIRDNPPSYMELAEFIHFNGIDVQNNLLQLWRRIIFNIAISNTDDHLRNHGFLLTNKGWILSPAYDINPSIEKNGLALNIDFDDNSLDFELAMSIGKYYQLNLDKMRSIINEVVSGVKKWRVIADELAISKSEQDLMSPAFRV